MTVIFYYEDGRGIKMAEASISFAFSVFGTSVQCHRQLEVVCIGYKELGKLCIGGDERSNSRVNEHLTYFPLFW